MTSIFHQNMRVFGGNSPGRNAAYTAGFGLIAGAMGGQDVVAAGFTEITNPNAPLRARLLNLSSVIDPGLTRVLVAEVGSTVFGGPEYLGMTWDPNYFTVNHAGAVAYNNFHRRWVTYVTAAAAFPASRVLRIPGGPFDALDSRGPAFLAGPLAGYGNVIIMFFHNMYSNGDRSNGYAGLQSCAQNIIEQLPATFLAPTVYVGGDYNVLPHDLRKRRDNMPLLSYRAQRAGDNPAGALINTTLANCYDFWLLSNPAAVALADVRVYAQSRGPLMSDHAAIHATI